MFIKSCLCLLIIAIAMVQAGVVPYVDVDLITKLYNNRIVGGYTAEPGQFKYQVSLRGPANNHFCGGSIISNQWILSVSHCLMGDVPENVTVVVGAHHIQSDGIAHAVERIILHEDFNLYLIINDIALLKLTEPILYTDSVGPIEFGSREHVGAGLESVFSGWGTTEYMGDLPEYLQYFEGITLTNPDCKSRHPQYSEFVHDDKICVYTGQYGRGMCHGDSGGPLVSDGKLIGAACWVEPCARGYPDVSTRISYHFDWIIDNMAEEE